MESTLPNHFFEFVPRWNDNIDFGYESKMLLKVLDNAQKENDVQKYIKDNKNGLYRLRFLRTMILGIMKLISFPNRLLAVNIVLTICCLVKTH